jgi:ferredoxin
MPIVSYEDKNQTLDLDENEIIFDGFERQGETLPHGCLSGSCGACRIEVLEGSENLKAPSSIEKNTIESIRESNADYQNKTIRLACRTRVLSAGEIRFTRLK